MFSANFPSSFTPCFPNRIPMKKISFRNNPTFVRRPFSLARNLPISVQCQSQTPGRWIDFELQDYVREEEDVVVAITKLKVWIEKNVEQKQLNVVGIDIHGMGLSVIMTFGVSDGATFILKVDHPHQYQPLADFFLRDDITFACDELTLHRLEELGFKVQNLVVRKVDTDDIFSESHLQEVKWYHEMKDEHRLFSRTKAVWLSIWSKRRKI